MKPIAYLHIAIFSLVGLLFNSCANKSQPTGGPKDEDPPKLLSSTPKHKQTNFTDQVIELTFDEYITLNSAKEQLIITPRTDQEYSINYKKDKVIIKFDSALNANTTYTLNFREAIKDLTEGNFPENLTIAFSTGPILDSLSIQGTVRDVLTTKPVQDATIGIYEVSDTLDLFTGKPLYFTKTNDAGEYTLENLKSAQYRIYAFKDNNKNLQAEMRTENYGFLNDTIPLDSSLVDINIPIQHLDISEFNLQNARVSGHYYTLKFNKFVRQYELTTPSTEQTLVSQLTNDNKEIKLYNTFDIKDSLFAEITAYDTIFQKIQDTVYVRFEDSKRSYDQFSASVSEASLTTKQTQLNLSIDFSKPVLSFNTDSIYIAIDSTHNLFLNKKDLFTWNENRTILNLSQIIPKDSLYIDSVYTNHKDDPLPNNLEVMLSRGTFISVDQDTSSLISSKLSILSPDNFGSINVSTETKETSFYIQLVSSKDEIVDEFTNQNKYTFNNVKPGEYKLRILIDTDGDGKWDPGNFYENKEPEPVKYYISEDGVETFTIRANWELDDVIIRF